MALNSRRPQPEKKILKSLGTSALLATLPFLDVSSVNGNIAILVWCVPQTETPPGNKLFLRFVCCIIARPSMPSDPFIYGSIWRSISAKIPGKIYVRGAKFLGSLKLHQFTPNKIFNCHGTNVSQEQYKNPSWKQLQGVSALSVGQNEKCYGNSSQVELVCWQTGRGFPNSSRKYHFLPYSQLLHISLSQHCYRLNAVWT